MKLYARILPRHFEQLEKGSKITDYRQLETITFCNTETGEEIEFEIEELWRPTDPGRIIREYPTIPWKKDKPIYAIDLGRRL